MGSCATPVIPSRASRSSIGGSVSGNLATNIDQVTVIEHGAFAVSDGRGDIVPGTYHGFFAADTRFLSRCVLRLGGRRLDRLSAGTANHRHAAFYLANPAMGRLPANSVAAVRDRRINDALTERIRVTSYVNGPLRLRLTVQLGADFADIFEVLGRTPLVRGVSAGLIDGGVEFAYLRGGYRRSTTILVDRPFRWERDRLSFDLTLRRGEPWELTMQVEARESARTTIRRQGARSEVERHRSRARGALGRASSSARERRWPAGQRVAGGDPRPACPPAGRAGRLVHPGGRRAVVHGRLRARRVDHGPPDDDRRRRHRVRHAARARDPPGKEGPYLPRRGAREDPARSPPWRAGGPRARAARPVLRLGRCHSALRPSLCRGMPVEWMAGGGDRGAIVPAPITRPMPPVLARLLPAAERALAWIDAPHRGS